MTQQYEIFGGDHGNYTICRQGNAAPVAFVRRNQTGGGYTVETAEGGFSDDVDYLHGAIEYLQAYQSRKAYFITMRNMPVDVMVANEIMHRLVQTLPEPDPEAYPEG